MFVCELDLAAGRWKYEALKSRDRLDHQIFGDDGHLSPCSQMEQSVTSASNSYFPFYCRFPMTCTSTGLVCSPSGGPYHALTVGPTSCHQNQPSRWLCGLGARIFGSLTILKCCGDFSSFFVFHQLDLSPIRRRMFLDLYEFLNLSWYAFAYPGIPSMNR
jgi:hypothetical protein